MRTMIAETAQAIACAGALNGLAQTLLRMTAPGVPDLYQGNEFWDFSLVDPDNRRPVDFKARQAALAPMATPQSLLDTWRDGHIKQALIARTLALRADYPQLFRRGRYVPLPVLGSQARRVLAFAREDQGQWAIVLVPIQVATLLESSAEPKVAAPLWGDTRVKLPFTLRGEKLKGLFSTPEVTHHTELLISAALGDFPVNLFIQP
ncbi:Maltooligosyl trehalose synthase [compost metagenome]